MKRLITVGMAFAIVCFVVSLACAQSTEWKYGECPPGVNKISQPTCSDVKDTFRLNITLDVSPIEDLSPAFGQAPAWNADGGFPGSERSACPKCGKAYPVNSRLKRLEHQP
jgi:hypothetical protein